MNPFDLRGPPFLLFYVVLGLLVMGALVLLRRAAENGSSGRANLTDPYSIACLRGGKKEVLRIAMVALLDRGLLTFQGDSLKTSGDAEPALGHKPIEHKILERLRTPSEAASVLEEADLLASAGAYEANLAHLGALPGPDTNHGRAIRFALGLAVLWGFAFTKVAVALSRGRHNIGFLILLALLFTAAAGAICFRLRTARGDTLLADLRTLFAGLKERAGFLRARESPEEVALVSAVFGLSALPESSFSYTRKVFRRRSNRSDSSSCGSSCGSGSCGGSCGGGGCGGGCGGCGG